MASAVRCAEGGLTVRWPLMWRNDHERIVAEYDKALTRWMDQNERLLERLEKKAVRFAVENCKPQPLGG